MRLNCSLECSLTNYNVRKQLPFLCNMCFTLTQWPQGFPPSKGGAFKCSVQLKLWMVITIGILYIINNLKLFHIFKNRLARDKCWLFSWLRDLYYAGWWSKAHQSLWGRIVPRVTLTKNSLNMWKIQATSLGTVNLQTRTKLQFMS